jgi:hypothetical protein
MKKEYLKPQMQVVNINSRHQLLAGSNLNRVAGNSGLRGAGTDGSITGGSGEGRSRGFDDWDDEE